MLDQKNKAHPNNDGKYESKIIHDDGIDYPAYVCNLEADSLDELKKITEEEIKRRERVTLNFLSQIKDTN